MDAPKSKLIEVGNNRAWLKKIVFALELGIFLCPPPLRFLLIGKGQQGLA